MINRIRKLQVFLKVHRLKRIQHNTVLALMMVVVFISTYILMIPVISLDIRSASTMSGIYLNAADSNIIREYDCDLEVHQHTKACYKKVPVFDNNGRKTGTEKILVCGKADYVVHEHDDLCYQNGDGSGPLICELPEIPEHVHDDTCYISENELTCGLEEYPAHFHDDNCYSVERILTCEKKEHKHDALCYEENEEGESVLVCEKEEHVHDTDCYLSEHRLTCIKHETEGHTHDDSCYTEVRTLICGENELHTHAKSCYDKESGELNCGQLEVIRHQHTDKCFKEIEIEDTVSENASDNDDEADNAVEPAESEAEEYEDIVPDTVETAAYDGADDFGTDYEEYPSDQETGMISDNTDEEIDYTGTDSSEEVPANGGAGRKFFDVKTEADDNVPENEGQVSSGSDENEYDETIYSLDMPDQETYDGSDDLQVPESDAEDESEEVIPGQGGMVFFMETESSESEASEGEAEDQTEMVFTMGNDETEESEEIEETGETVETGETEEGIFFLETQEQNETDEMESAESEESEEVTETEESELPEEEPVVFEAAIHYIRVEGASYSLKIEYGSDAQIPGNAVFKATALPDTSDDYSEYENKALDAVKDNEASSDEDLQVLMLFDITIYGADGEIIEPKGPVNVSVDMAKRNRPELKPEIYAVHFPEEGVTDGEVMSAEHDGDGTIMFDAESFSLYAIVGIKIEKTILASDGQNYRITVTCPPDSGIPKNADLAVSEILDVSELYEDYVSKTENALGIEEGSAEYIRVFDISIIDKDDPDIKYQPAEGTTVDVKIELEDAQEDNNLNVVHFADENAEGDLVEAEVNGQTVTFAAEGFSAYAIVQGPTAVPLGWLKITSIEELTSNEGGLYIGHPNGFYFGNTLTSDSKRTGITKTKPAQIYPAAKAAKYFFEAVEGSDNQVYAYCFAADGVTRQYVFNGGNNSLSFTTDDSEKTAFTVTDNGDGTFKFNNGAWYWNMQGGDNGARFCSYNSVNDTNNNLNIWYYTDLAEDPYSLDGLSYGLMNWSGGVAGKALMANSSEGALDAKSLTVMSTTNNSSQLFVPNDSDIAMWTFHWVSDDKYYISVVQDGSTKYLNIDENGLSLESTQDTASQIQVIPGSGIHAGEISLTSAGATLTYSGTVDNGFSVNGEAGSEWLKLVDLSELTTDYFLTYSAGKVSVSDESITNGSRVIVYTRSWNEEKLKYDYYAISSDGSLVPVYESGDSIEWVSGQINTLLWNFVEYYWEETGDVNYYYDLYNQYSEKFIAPQITDSQILSDDTLGINLNGRRDGQYYSSILAWDESNYSYVGLKVEDGQIVACPKSEAMDFYFAVMRDLNVDDTLTTVKTVDNTQYGISMKIIDFNDRPTMSNFLGNDQGGLTTKLQQGLLSTDLTDGYPTAKGGSLGNLYSKAQDVNHLFIQSTYEETGYFEFDSAQNFASLRGETGGDFTVYKELGTYDSAGGRYTLKHGQFFPFNDLKPGVFTSTNGKNLYYSTGDELPDSDARKYEQLYSVEFDGKKANTYFGLELEASFSQTPSGLDAWGHDIIFEFTGDDDFWLYVDGELVIDLGGIHSAVPGSVNFRTGSVNVNGTKTTLRELFTKNYKKRNPKAAAAEVEAYLAQYFDEGSTVFRDDTTHTMKIFYMERGAGASNLHMRFNLAAVKKGTVQLTKTLSGVDENNILAEFPYQILYKKADDDTEYRLTNLIADDPLHNEDYVFYKDTVNPVKYEQSAVIDGITYQDVFFLKPGETADIGFPEGAESYRIVECGVNTEVYSSVSANGKTLSGTEIPGNSTRMDYGIDYATTDARSKVNYVNAVNPDALRLFTIQKKLYREDGTTEIPYSEDSTQFMFRLYLASEFDELDVANMHTYHVKDEDGHYCRWDTASKKFVKIGGGISDYMQLTDEEKTAASFTTSIYGTISNIPTGFTIEIRDVLAGTQYHVEERPAEIPDGYSFQKYTGYDTDNAEVVERDGSGVNGVRGTVVSGKDASVVVCNLKGWGLRMNKIWRDEEYMSSRDPVYFALFTINEGSLILVPDSVRQLPYSAKPQTIYWYYDRLPVIGTTGVDDYLIREVTLSAADPTVSREGIVSDYGTVTPIETNETLNLNGVQKGEDSSSEFIYTVQYEEGQISDESNVRVDVVTNDRPGIILKKEDWSGNPLDGAVFELKDNNGNLLGTFTSGQDGFITTAFLSNNKEYTLTETISPKLYHGPETAFTISVDNGFVTVNGPDPAYYELTQAEGTTLATLVIKNRPYTFRAVKKDQDTDEPMPDVVFALHRQVTVDNVTAIDLSPMPGYEELVTDADGTIPKLDNTLPAGTYELREKATIDGYEMLTGYIQFTISPTGEIELGTHPEDVTLTGEPNSEDAIEYVLTVFNHQRKKVSFKKVDIANVADSALKDAVFDLYAVKEENGKEVRQTPALYTDLISGSDGLLRDSSDNTVFELPIGIYHLVETAAPAGYIIKEDAVVITVTADDLIYEDGTNISSDGTGRKYDKASKVYTLKVSNNAGYELPATGGPGTRLFYLLGMLMIILAGTALIKRDRRRAAVPSSGNR